MIVVDAADGTVLGNIDLGGVPEQTVADGQGTVYQACAAVGPAPARGTPGAPAPSGPPAPPDPNAKPPQAFVILSAKDGKILTRLPLAGNSDGAVFNPATMEAFSSQGNGTMTIVKEKSPTSFEVEQNLQTMNGARTITFDSKTGHLFVMAQEFGAPDPNATPPAGGRAGRGPAIPGSFTILMIGK